jgi:hypothetical protein
MTSLDQTHRQKRWPAIAATAVAQLAVLLLIAWGLVAYLNWSSAAAMAEFTAATKPPAAAPGESHASIPLRPARHQTLACPRGA